MLKYLGISEEGKKEDISLLRRNKAKEHRYHVMKNGFECVAHLFG
jgi:hypothetical protein